MCRRTAKRIIARDMGIGDLPDNIVSGKQDGRRPHYAFVVLGMGMLTVVGALGLARYPYALILPSMKEALGLSYTEMGLLATGFFSGYLVFAVITSIVSARSGARIVMLVSMLVAALALAATGLAQGFGTALAARTLAGAATAGGYVQAMSLPSSWFTLRRRGMAAGSQTGGLGIGFVATGFLIPWILVSHGEPAWRYAWFYLGAILLVIAVIGGIWVRNRPSEKGLLPFGPPDPPTSSPTAPLTLGKIYTSPVLWHISLVYLLYGFTNIVVMTFFTAFLTKEMGLDVAQAGVAWAVLGVMVTFGGLTWGAVSDRIGRSYGLAISLLFLGLAAFALTASPNLAFIYLSAAVFGFSLTGAPAIVAAASGDYFGPRLAAPALGFLTVSFGLGQAIGPGVAGYIADMTGSFVFSFWLAGAACLLGSLGSVLLRR